jgi:hypothetical protein
VSLSSKRSSRSIAKPKLPMIVLSHKQQVASLLLFLTWQRLFNVMVAFLITNGRRRRYVTLLCNPCLMWWHPCTSSNLVKWWLPLLHSQFIKSEEVIDTLPCLGICSSSPQPQELWWHCCH